ncbi:MAG TPA: hypothetical protein ENK55_12450 [Actinobacteria bacterium]|nr:hypothetical protein [Actinomycetota bacterium]
MLVMVAAGPACAPGGPTGSQPTLPSTESAPTSVVDTTSTTVRVGEGLPNIYSGPPVADRPTRWVGLIQAPNDHDLVVIDDDGAPSVVLDEGQATGAETPPQRFETIALSDSDGTLWLGRCCEPASGSLWTLDANGTLAFAADGLQTDEGGWIRAIVSATGDLSMAPVGDPDRALFLFDVGARSVAVDPNGIVVTLLGDDSVLPGSSVTGLAPSVRLSWISATGFVHRDHLLPAGYRACSVTWSYDGTVVLLDRSDSETGNACTGTGLSRLDPVTGEFVPMDVGIPDPATTVRVDASGTYLLYVTVSGEVRWRSLDDGDAGLLDAGDYVAADW